MNVHPTATVHPDARIGRDAIIGPYAYIEAGVVVGDRCRIGPHAVLLRFTTLGPDCAVHTGAVLGDVPQDLAFKDAPSFVQVSAGTVIREGVTIHRGTKEGTATRVGEGCLLMANSHLAHNVALGNRVILANGALLGGYAEIGDGAFVSGNAGIHQFVRVGRLAMVGGLAVLTKDLPPFCTAATGCRNRVAGVNIVGLRRAGITPLERSDVRKAFRSLYLRGCNLREAALRITNDYPAGPARELGAFVVSSKRGVCVCRIAGGAGTDEDAEP